MDWIKYMVETEDEIVKCENQIQRIVLNFNFENRRLDTL